MTQDHDLVVHVGAPKCGSSALQTVLSEAPDIAALEGGRFAYCAFDARGGLISGRALRARAAATPFGYVSSPSLRVAPPGDRVAGIAEAIRQVRATQGVPVLSSESWVREAEAFVECDLIARSGGRAHVVLFVRPPVEWLNSAWWQWGVWSTATLDRFVGHNMRAVRWHVLARAWAQVPGVARVSVVPLAGDVVEAFAALIGARIPGRSRSNGGVPPAMLHFLLRNRRFRATAHAPQVEFAIARHLGSRQAPAPWVLSPEQVARVFEKTPHLARGLRKLLAPEDAARMDADRRWWTPDAFADRVPDVAEAHQGPDALVALHAALWAPLDAAARRRLAGQPDRVRAAAARGDVAGVDAEIAGLVDWIVAQDARRGQAAVS